MKKILLFIVPLVLIGGVIAAGMFGMIPIPGLSPSKKKPSSLYLNGERDMPLPGADNTATTRPTSTENRKSVAKPARKSPNEASVNPLKGAKKLAKLWNELPSGKLAEISKGWKVDDLALVLANMDAQKVAEFLSSIDAKRASELSMQIQSLGSTM